MTIRQKRYLSILFAFMLAVSLSIPSVGAAQPGTTDTDEIIVKYKEGLPSAAMSALHKKADAEVLNRNAQLGFEVVKVEDASLEQAIDIYEQNNDVEYAEPNITFHTYETPNDPMFDQQWGPQQVEAPAAWDVTKGSDQVEVAIVDTGVDYDHPDLSGKVIKGGDFVDNDGDPMDENGHGTHCAGIAAASTNNGVGIAGMAPNVSIYAVRVLDANGSGSLDAVAEGIIDAADNGSEVISLSLGAPTGAQTLEEAVQYAADKGSVVVAAAGNSGLPTPSYPAYYSDAIAVAATDSNDSKASFSNYGNWVDIAAPGVDILSTYPGGDYQSLSGTSMATPHVAGLAGLLASQERSASEVRSAIEQTADPISGTGTYWENGRINANQAVNY